MGNKTERAVRAVLDECGLSYSIIPGKRHEKVYVNGRLVGNISRDSNSHRDCKNLISAIRRIAKETT